MQSRLIVRPTARGGDWKAETRRPTSPLPKLAPSQPEAIPWPASSPPGFLLAIAGPDGLRLGPRAAALWQGPSPLALGQDGPQRVRNGTPSSNNHGILGSHAAALEPKGEEGYGPQRWPERECLLTIPGLSSPQAATLRTPMGGIQPIPKRCGCCRGESLTAKGYSNEGLVTSAKLPLLSEPRSEEPRPMSIQNAAETNNTDSDVSGLVLAFENDIREINEDVSSISERYLLTKSTLSSLEQYHGIISDESMKQMMREYIEFRRSYALLLQQHEGRLQELIIQARGVLAKQHSDGLCEGLQGVGLHGRDE
ncbi:uncharacterized protein VTP21DRAFT_11729 [Calcarisporiella thermophila]|uniref:uncharacterized protein n=1 Tax=Calcarisporiella thermophila TaxID=911321 RepID=UPI0037420702